MASFPSNEKTFLRIPYAKNFPKLVAFYECGNGICTFSRIRECFVSLLFFIYLKLFSRSISHCYSFMACILNEYTAPSIKARVQLLMFFLQQIFASPQWHSTHAAQDAVKIIAFPVHFLPRNLHPHQSCKCKSR